MRCASAGIRDLGLRFPEAMRNPKNGARILLLASITLWGVAALAQQTPTPAANPAHSPGNARWAQTAEEARQRAATEGKFVFLEFDRPKCGLCHRMDSLLYPAFDFEALLIDMVPVKLNIDSLEGKAAAQRYGVQQVPAILITTPEERLVFLMEGFRNTEDFYPHVREDTAKYRKLARLIEAQDIPHLSVQEALGSGLELYQRSDPAAALPRLKRALAAPKLTPAMRDEALEVLAAVEFDLGQIRASRQTIERLIATTKDRLCRERAELFRAQIPLAENKPEEAAALFRKFQKDHPTSPYMEKLNELLARAANPVLSPTP